MGQGIVKMFDCYVRWSSVCDAPAQLYDDLDSALDACETDGERERLRTTGTSYTDMDAEKLETFALWNRAGPNETCIGRETMVSAMKSHAVHLFVDGRWSYWRWHRGSWSRA